MGTEIPVTVPSGSLFGQLEYSYAVNNSGTDGKITSHALPMEFEIGLGKHTQINLEGEILLEERADPMGEKESGIEELAFGLKRRLSEETSYFPASAFLVEYAPASGLEGSHSEFKTSLLLGKTLGNRVHLYISTGYLLETKRETEGSETEVENVQHFQYHFAPAVTIIPHHIIGLVEFIGETDFKHAQTEAVLMPELIVGNDDISLKVGIPLGLTSESADYGVRVALSRFFN
ncbi:MAG TPA: hypothetical protein VLB09_06945 [Nitrospiria bacterium]|nr:hypothetical protein [Nitrospiria bacterium]